MLINIPDGLIKSLVEFAKVNKLNLDKTIRIALEQFLNELSYLIIKKRMKDLKIALLSNLLICKNNLNNF
jgi:hypothetical protein